MQVKPGTKNFFFKLHTGTLLVKSFQEPKGFFLPWGSHCFICKQLETIDHIFLHCWEGVYFWDVLQRTMKKELPLSSHGIRFLPTHNEEGMLFDLVMLMDLHSIWFSRMARYHCNPDTRPAHLLFRESTYKFTEEQKLQTCHPVWLSTLERLMELREFLSDVCPQRV